jgi:hypothetical protein
MFWHDCKEWQSQSFSSVGAQHQNAHAEHAIQNIMYMARTSLWFMPPSIGQKESQMISLSGPLQVKSSVQVYNDVPDVWSGLSP